MYLQMINRILSHEGGYVNDPRDPGGETNWGISKRSYPNLPIKSLTREQAIALYERDFWVAHKLNKIPEALAYQVLDFAVNSGAGTAIRALQRAAGVADDGVIGPHTLEAISKCALHDLVMRLTAERLMYLTKCKAWPTYGKGWVLRVAKNLQWGADDV